MMLVKDMVTEDFLDDAARIMSGEPYLSADAQEQLRDLIGQDALDALKAKLTPDESKSEEDVVVDVDKQTVLLQETEDLAKQQAELLEQQAEAAKAALDKIEELDKSKDAKTTDVVVSDHLTVKLDAPPNDTEGLKRSLEACIAALPEGDARAKCEEVLAQIKSVKKDAIDTFSEYLDDALDVALLNGIDAIYYAWIKTFSGGGYWDIGDPDQLSREDFTKVCQAFADACITLYDKLADDEEADDPEMVMNTMKAHFAEACANMEASIRSRMLDKITAMQETKSTEDEVVEDKEEKQFNIDWADAALKRLQSVTAASDDKTVVADDNDATETQKRLDAVTAELEQVKAGSSGLLEGLTEVQKELQKRVEAVEAAKDVREPDPLEAREPVQISNKGRKSINLSGRLEHVPTQLVEDTDNI